jgi:hypothetical protein
MGFATTGMKVMKTCKPSLHLAIVVQEEVISYLPNYIFKLVEGKLNEDCGLLGCIVQTEPDISEKHTASIFRVEE